MQRAVELSGALDCFSDLERSLGIATVLIVTPACYDRGFSDLERSLGIATFIYNDLSVIKSVFQ